jgi:hypothetical protein
MLLAGLWFANGLLWAPFVWPAPVSPPVVPAPPTVPVLTASADRPHPHVEAPPAPKLAPAATVASAVVPDTQALRQCLAGRTFAGGKLLLRVAVSPAGQVKKVAPVAGDFLAPTDERCLERALRSWHWTPPNDEPGEVLLTVVL